jgi:hypothetical protein
MATDKTQTQRICSVIRTPWKKPNNSVNCQCEIIDNNAYPCVILPQMYDQVPFAMKNSKLIESYFLTL